MAIPPWQLVDLVRSGGSVSIDSDDYVPGDLLPVVQAMSARALVIVRHAERWSQPACQEIASATTSGIVLFEFASSFSGGLG